MILAAPSSGDTESAISRPLACHSLSGSFGRPVFQKRITCFLHRRTIPVKTFRSPRYQWRKGFRPRTFGKFASATLAPFQSLSNWPVRMKFNFIYGLWIANRTPSYTTADDIKVPTQLWLLMVIVLGFKVVKRTVVDNNDKEQSKEGSKRESRVSK
ncbi:hypothetical protein T4B_2523 [Trichinella pseudospiralis]|nr:hypothetical protein T4B_2523 [Trichinella pseudospiralis]